MYRPNYRLGPIDYSGSGFRPLLRSYDFKHPDDWPMFKDLPPPQDWMAELNKILEKTIDS